MSGSRRRPALPPVADTQAGSIDVWCIEHGMIGDAGLLARYRALLSDAERARAQRFYFAADRHRFLVTRAAVRTILSRYAALAPAQWAFKRNAYGRPAIANPGLGASLAFNLSHSRELIVIAVAGAGQFGIDTEAMLARPAPLAQADHFFSRAEAAALRALPGHLQQARFFQLWTLKESYIKARGMGLSIPLAQFGFSFAGDDALRLCFDAGWDDDPARWDFRQFLADGDHLVALCSAASGAAPAPVRFMKCVPLAGVAQADFPLLAHTRRAPPP
jgi:4'-phosphopantetheinyl transferase